MNISKTTNLDFNESILSQPNPN